MPQDLFDLKGKNAVRAKTGRRAVGVACHVGRWENCNQLVAGDASSFTTGAIIKIDGGAAWSS